MPTEAKTSTNEAGTDRVRSRRSLAVARTIQRELMLALAGELNDEKLVSLDVRRVEPTSGGRFQVAVGCSIGQVRGAVEISDLLQRLERVKPFLRARVAQTLQRRKVPDFAFRWEGSP